MAVRRSPWLDNRAQLLVRLLAERGHEIGEDIAREDISDHLDLVAERMRIGRQAAKVYVTDEVIEHMAERIARYVDQKQTKEKFNPRHLRVVPPLD